MISANGNLPLQRVKGNAKFVLSRYTASHAWPGIAICVLCHIACNKVVAKMLTGEAMRSVAVAISPTRANRDNIASLGCVTAIMIPPLKHTPPHNLDCIVDVSLSVIRGQIFQPVCPRRIQHVMRTNHSCVYQLIVQFYIRRPYFHFVEQGDARWRFRWVVHVRLGLFEEAEESAMCVQVG